MILKNYEERERIAKAGRLRATRDQAQNKLLEKVFNTIEIDLEANAERILTPILVLQVSNRMQMTHAQLYSAINRYIITYIFKGSLKSRN